MEMFIKALFIEMAQVCDGDGVASNLGNRPGEWLSDVTQLLKMSKWLNILQCGQIFNMY
jgi:hypothetical protein